MISVVKYVNKIRARGLSRREFREYCGLLDMQYGDLILHGEVHRFSRGQVLRTFLKLNNVVHNFLEENYELPEEKFFFFFFKWIFDLAFTVDVTSHPNDLSLKLL